MYLTSVSIHNLICNFMVQTAQWFPECKHPHQQFIEFYHWKIVFWDLVNQFSRLNVYIFTNVQGWKWSSLNVFLTVKPMIIGRVQFLLKCVWMFHVFRKKNILHSVYMVKFEQSVNAVNLPGFTTRSNNL